MARKVSTSQQAILDRLAEVAEQRHAIEEAYVEGILEASNEGISNAEIGRALGISGETIRQIIARRTEN